SMGLGQAQAGEEAGKTTIRGSGLAKEAIQHEIQRHLNAIRFCYERELAKNPELGGKVTAQWAIGTQGKVESVKIQRSTLRNERVESCLGKVIRRMTFPPPSETTNVVYPFNFKSAKK
ncbi:MAG: AgmX/PglI C-terminal domain-containing protein, partial [Myxococcota bacterium]